MKKKYKRGEMEKILLVGLALGSATLGFGIIPGLGLAYMLFEPQNYHERARIKQLLNRLKRKKFLKIQNNKENVTLTQKGRKYTQKYEIDKIVLTKTKKWDKKWRVIIFDIPESKRNARYALSRKLKNLNCYLLQKSVYIFPYACFNEINIILEYFDVSKYVFYIEAQKINDDRKLRKFFKL